MRNLQPDSNDRAEPQAASKDAQLDRLDKPAMLALRLIQTVRRSLQRWHIRRSLRALLARDDHILRDLGYSRAGLRRRLKDLHASEWPANGRNVRENQ